MNATKDKNSLYEREEQIYGYIKNQKNAIDEEHECWASDSGSSSESYYSNSSSSAIEWESDISPTGEVFYIESLIETISNSKVNDTNYNISSPLELTRRRSTRASKLTHLMKRKESYRRSQRINGFDTELKQNNEIIKRINREGETFTNNFQTGEKYIVNIWVDPEKRHKLGRRATACEAYLGIIPYVTSEKSRIIVAGFVHDGEALKNKDIKIGDLLQSINSTEINNQNIDNVLSEITSPTNVVCQLQRICLDGSYENFQTTISCPNQSLLARQIVDKEESKILMDSLLKDCLGVLCIKITEFSENESDMQNVLYSFPKSKNKNVHSFLLTMKGAFITLNHMLPDIVSTKPVSTTILTSNGLAYVMYFGFDEELLLISIPEKFCNKQEAMELSKDIVCCLAFTNENLSKCFVKEENHLYLDHFFYQFFSRFNKDKIMSNTNFENFKNYANSLEIRQSDFNFLLPAVHFIQLPRDAQIQIDAALSEMEAMDYRDWNQDPIECQRLYTILGSCLYHRKYLLGSHLPSEDLIQVHSFLRRHGLIYLMNTEQVKSLVIWKRIYPSSCVNKKLTWEDENVYPLAECWFLLIVGYGYDLLAVILESGGCTAILEENSGPDIFYVEEAQETLKHIRKIGISMLAEKWINANAKPEVITPCKESTLLKMSSSIAENFVGFIKTNPAKGTGNLTFNLTKTTHDKDTSILRNKSSEESRFELNSAYSLEKSQDSPSQDSLSQVSEVSDQTAPILGRRATRERTNMASKHSDDSDSDMDSESTEISDISNIRENLLNQAEYIVPKIITTGDKNTLIYYVHLDLFEGILMSSKLGQLDREFLSNLNIYTQTIHKLLSDTKRYKKLLSYDANKSVINKNLIAIKEHGILFEWENNTYWLVGRLYDTPKPKELYICYQDCTPQNLIEMAFRLQSTNC